MSSRGVFLMAVVSVVLASAFIGAGEADAQVVWVVEGNDGNIQAAIDAASDGDVVCVYRKPNGNPYSENIDFNGKAVRVYNGEMGGNPVVINGGQNGSVVTFDSGEDSSSRLVGFTVVNGSGTSIQGVLHGGGIVCQNGSAPRIEDCIIQDNSAYYGGGIACVDESAPVITGCRIVENTATNGGGIACLDDANPTITSCEIGFTDSSYNQASADGGGIYCSDSCPPITLCEILYNVAGDDGGGIYCYDSCPAIEVCQINYNDGAHEGGGIYVYISGYESLPRVSIVENHLEDNGASEGGGIYLYTADANWEVSAEIKNNQLWNNSADAGGAGMYIERSAGKVDIAYNWFKENTADHPSYTVWGGGLFIYNAVGRIYFNYFVRNTADAGGGIYDLSTQGGTEIVNNLFAENVASQDGGGLYIGTSSAQLANNTMTENTATSGVGGGICVDSTYDVVLDNCIVWGNAAYIASSDDYAFGINVTVRFCDIGGYPPGGGNIDADPVFKTTGEKVWAKKLRSNSPCVDTANNYLDLTDYDFEGDDREIDGDGNQTEIVDMGWDEYDPNNP